MEKKLIAPMLGCALVAALVVPEQVALADTIDLNNVSTGKVAVKVGQSYKIGAAFSKKGKVSYTSSKSSVASVTGKGAIKAKKVGKATVKVKLKTSSGTSEKSIAVTVVNKSNYKKPKKIAATLSQKSAPVGATVKAGASFYPTNASNKNLRFSSSKPSVATVSSTGKVTCLAKGTTTISVKTVDGGKKSSVKLTVGDLKANPASDFTYKAGTYCLEGAVKTERVPGVESWTDGDARYEATAQYGPYIKGDYSEREDGDWGSSGSYGQFSALTCGEGIYITGVKASAKGYVVVPDTIDGKPVVCASFEKVRNATGFNFSLCNGLKAVRFCDIDANTCFDSIDFGPSNAAVQSFEMHYEGVDKFLDLSPLTDLRALVFDRTNGVHNGWVEDADNLEFYHEEFVGFSHMTLADKQNLKEAVLYGDWYSKGNLTLSNLPNLEILDISANQFKSFDTSAFSKLKRFTCDENIGIKDLDVAKNPDLEYLSCAECSISSIDVSKNPKLTDLRLHSNKLASLDLSGSSRLQKLECPGNKLTSLDLSGCPALAELNCSGNSLKTLNLSGCVNLTDLDCGDNKIASLDLGAMSKLKSIQASDSGLKSLVIPVGGSLEDIDATGCKFDSSSFASIVSWAKEPGHYADIDGFDDEYDDEDEDE